MAFRHIAPGKLLDACRYWYPQPQRTRKLMLAGCGYLRLAMDFEKLRRLNRVEDNLDVSAESSDPSTHRLRAEHQHAFGHTPDKFAYDSLWCYGPPNIPGGRRCEELNGITLCVFGLLTEDESRKSPEVDRFDSRWRTEAVVGVAAKAYDERAFGVLPILADALEEAGCDNLPMLAHCREATIHTRGCWVLDHILGKG